MTVNRYIPPLWTPWEFDAHEAPRRNTTHRTFRTWGGTIGHPAELVTLDWSGDARGIEVNTRILRAQGHEGVHHTARLDAAHTLLGGMQPFLEHKLEPRDAGAEIGRVLDDVSAWEEQPIQLDGAGARGRIYRYDEHVLLGYVLLDGDTMVVSFAARGLTPAEFRFRPLTEESAMNYDCDPFVAHA